jgi:type I restriction enzyme S subunit
LNNIGVGQFNDENKAFIDLRRLPSLRRHEARAGDILTAALGDPLGKSCLVPDGIGPAIVKADCFRSRLHKRINASLIVFWLNSPALARYFADNGKGVGRVRITLANLRNAPLPLPPEAEQVALVERLQTVVDRAHIAKAEAEQALAAAQALKVSGLRAGVMGHLTALWRETSQVSESVGDLLARVSSPAQKLSGRRATNTIVPGQAAIAVNDPKSALPPGWRWVPLLQLARQETGHTPSRQHPEYWNGDVDWLGIRDARKHHGAVIERTSQRITQAGLDASSARLLPARTVCLSRTASVGYVTILGRPMATSQDFVTWTCTPALLPEYLMYALMAEDKGIRRFGRGSTHTTIYFSELRAFHIALPPLEEQRAVVSRIKRLLHRADTLATEAARARLAADSLITKTVNQAMSGALGAVAPTTTSAWDLLAVIADERRLVGAKGRRHAVVEERESESAANDILVEAPVTGAELNSAIRQAGGSLRADQLWKQSGLPIENFYRLIRDEIAAGRIRESADKESLLAH